MAGRVRRPAEAPLGEPAGRSALGRDVAGVAHPGSGTGRRVGEGFALGGDTDRHGAAVGIGRHQPGAELVERAFDGHGETRFAGFDARQRNGYGEAAGSRQRIGLEVEELRQLRPFHAQERGGLVGGQAAGLFLEKRLVNRRQPRGYGSERRLAGAGPQEVSPAAGHQGAAALGPADGEFQGAVSGERRAQRRAQRRGLHLQDAAASERRARMAGEGVEEFEEGDAGDERHPAGHRAGRGGDALDDPQVLGQEGARGARGVEHRAVAADGEFEDDLEFAVPPGPGEVGGKDDVQPCRRGGIGLEGQRGRHRLRRGTNRLRRGGRRRVHAGDDRQADRHGVRADRAVLARRAAGAEVFDVCRGDDLQAGAVFAVALPDAALQQRGRVRRATHPARFTQAPGMPEHVPAAGGDEKFFGQRHRRAGRQGVAGRGHPRKSVSALAFVDKLCSTSTVPATPNPCT